MTRYQRSGYCSHNPGEHLLETRKVGNRFSPGGNTFKPNERRLGLLTSESVGFNSNFALATEFMTSCNKHRKTL